jgi:plastocyanin
MSPHHASGAGFILVLALLCGSAWAGPSAAHVVVIEGVRFTPEVLSVKSGDWVQWINKDPFPHTVTSPGSFDSHSIAAGGTWKHRMRKTGELQYTCTFHPNMKAALRVEP